jgi:hypothetical protein
MVPRPILLRGEVVKSLIIPLVLLLAASFASPKDQEKRHDKVKSVVVDSGSFGIYLNGKRMGTEKFSIEQQAGEGVLTAAISVDDGTTRAEQSSEMRVAADGNLRLYKWRSTVPAMEESIVEPTGDFLVEHITFAGQKKRDVPYILPLSTVILDDNFFSHRELLIWRYLASGCTRQSAQLACRPAHFGILVPQHHLAGSVTVELVGRDTIAVRGVQNEMNKVKLEYGSVEFPIWVDDDYKVIKVGIPSMSGNNGEVVRD